MKTNSKRIIPMMRNGVQRSTAFGKLVFKLQENVGGEWIDTGELVYSTPDLVKE